MTTPQTPEQKRIKELEAELKKIKAAVQEDASGGPVIKMGADVIPLRALNPFYTLEMIEEWIQIERERDPAVVGVVCFAFTSGGGIRSWRAFGPKNWEFTWGSILWAVEEIRQWLIQGRG